MTSIPSKREARRARDKEDFLRATRAKVPAKLREEAGRYAGPTYREHLENKLASACAKYKQSEVRGEGYPQRDILRGMIRGLAMALLIYEDSYSMNDKAKLLEIERSFMK